MKELLIGDPVPGLKPGEFLKGDPVADIIPGKIYVVEFWASWCGPCRANLPGLSELQKKFPGVCIIGVSTESDVEAAKAYVARETEHIGYRLCMDARLAADETDGWMTRHWLHANFQLGIPAAFIVDTAGKLAWSGHPAQLETPLSEVVAGSWDLPAAAQAHREALLKNRERERFRLQREISALARSGGDHAALVSAIDKGLSANPILETYFGPQKLIVLMTASHKRRAAVAYARHLIDNVLHDDANGLLQISVFTFRPDQPLIDDDGIDYSAELIGVSIQAAKRVENLLDLKLAELTPSVAQQFETHFARALLAAGQTAEARGHALRALHWGKETGASDKDMAQLDELVGKCR